VPITDQFSGPGRAIGPVCVSVCPDNNFSNEMIVLDLDNGNAGLTCMHEYTLCIKYVTTH